jgi:heme-degrading monooxygenase HmoA
MGFSPPPISTAAQTVEVFMIVRLFRAIVHDGKQNEFKDFFLREARPYVEKQAGLVSLFIGLPTEQSPNEFLMVMHWENIEFIKDFAGEEWNQAVILDEERSLLKEVFLHHYELAE